MKKEDLEKVAEYFIRNSPAKVKKKISRDDFFLLLDLHPEGRKRVESLWQSEIDEGEFPPKEMSLMSYYFMLLEYGLITEYQYDQLNKEI
jgi:hypothetical protein